MEQQEKFSLWELLKFVIIAAVIVIPVRLWVAQPFVVSGASMEPSFFHGDYLIIDEISYQFREPERDEVVVFRYPDDPSKFFIKRVAALPGETVETIRDRITLGDTEYFVVGDNRGASSDSRVWGPLDRSLIVGRALVRLWPVREIGYLPGHALATQP